MTASGWAWAAAVTFGGLLWRWRGPATAAQYFAGYASR